MTRIAPLTLVALLIVALQPDATLAHPAHSFSEVALSGPSGLTSEAIAPGGCGWDAAWAVAWASGAASPPVIEADYESTLAVDPKDSKKMTAVWLQDDGLLVGSATSLDGGKSWNRGPLPGITTCSGGVHRTTYDARVAIGPTGIGSSRAYAIATSQNQPFPDPRAGVSYVSVTTMELEQGRWDNSVVVDATASIDWPVIAADSNNPDTAYAMWSKRLDATFFSATHDGGTTWSTPTPVRITTPGHLALNEIVVSSNGTLLNIYQESPLAAVVDPSIRSTLFLSRSVDGGLTWTDGERITTDSHSTSFSLVESPAGLFAAWTRATSDGGGEVVIARQQTGEWEELQAFASASNPELGVMSDGTIGVAYYETAIEPSSMRAVTRVIAAHSHDNGVEWETTDISGTTDSASVFVGDHGSIEATQCGFASTWTTGPEASEHGRSDIFFATLGIAGVPQGPCRAAPNS